MFTNDKSTLTYLCKTRKDGNIWPATTNVLEDCYLRDKLINEEFNSKDLNDLDDCDIKEYADNDLSECYLTSNRKELIYKSDNNYTRIRYFEKYLYKYYFIFIDNFNNCK